MTAAWGWLGILAGNIAWIVPFDLWLHFTHRHTLTRQMHDWLFNPGLAQFIIAGSAGFVIWLVVHLATYHARVP